MAAGDATERVPETPTSALHRSSPITLADGGETTLHVARFDRRRLRARVVVLEPPAQLLGWCRNNGVADAMVGGFFRRPEGRPLGELRVAGERRPHDPFDSPWNDVRSCVALDRGRIALASRSRLAPDPPGDLLQAGPLLVEDGRVLIESGSDPEGFSAGSRQFDSDITDGRYPRAALGFNGDELIAAVCDGRGERDQGLDLRELAEQMADLGSTAAINLDGGGSASLVLGCNLINRPREEHGIDLVGGRPISTAIVFEEHGSGGSA